MKLRLGLGSKFILLVVAILVTTLGLTAYYTIKTQSQLFAEQLDEKGRVLGHFVSLISPEAIFAYDFTSLNDFSREVTAQRDIVFCAVLDAEGRPITSYVDSEKPLIKKWGIKASLSGVERFINKAPSAPSLLWLEFPIEHQTRNLGTVVVAVSRERLEQVAQQAMLVQGGSYIGIILFLILCIYAVFRLSVLRPVQGLVHASERVARGQFKVPVEIHTDDEMGRLAKSFNQMMHDLHEEEEQLRKLSRAVEQSPVSTIITDRNGTIEYVNPRFTTLTGYQAGEVRGKNPRILKSGFTKPETYRAMWDTLTNGDTWTGEFYNIKKNGEGFWAESIIVPIRSVEGEITHYLALTEDISQRKEYEKQLFHQANFDPITGLPNRSKALKDLTQDLKQAQHDGRKVAVLYLDLDNFKAINDTLGHATGDRLLLEVGQRIRKALQKKESVSRIGGDEFLVVVTESDDKRHAGAVAERLIDAIRLPFLLEGRELFINASVGITFYPDDGEEPYHLLRNADAAMYSAKNSHQNSYSYFTQELSRAIARRMVVEAALRVALERNEMSIHYQPLWDVAKGRIIGAEALLRWHCEAIGGAVSPVEFIPLAENNGTIGEIGNWVLQQACQQLRQWDEAGYEPLLMSVNASANQFAQGRILNSIKRCLDSTGITAERLKIEVTETAIMQSPGSAIEIMREIKEQGVLLAIDDFGTGYSSLSYLLHMPLDLLKIDRSFITAVEQDGDETELVASIIALAKSIGMHTIAEGVETPAQFEKLAKLGVDTIQGYLISRPLPPQEFEQLLKEGEAREAISKRIQGEET